MHCHPLLRHCHQAHLFLGKGQALYTTFLTTGNIAWTYSVQNETINILFHGLHYEDPWYASGF